MIEPRNDFGDCRRSSRAGCGPAPRRISTPYGYGIVAVELDRQFGEAAIYMAGSAYEKNPVRNLDDSIRVALVLLHSSVLLRSFCCSTTSPKQPHPSANLWMDTGTERNFVCRAGFVATGQAITVQRGTCLSAHDKSAATVLCRVTGLRRQRPPVW